MLRVLFILTLVSFTMACNDPAAETKTAVGAEAKAGFTELDPQVSGLKFVNTIAETESINALSWDAIFSGAGVGIADFDGDGLEDIFLAGNQVNDALFRNLGDMKFEDVSASSGITDHAGWSMGVSVIDIDADGDLDIYVTRNSGEPDGMATESKRNKLFVNQGGMQFTEEAKAYGLDHPGYGIQSVFLDHDRDGDLDMYLVNSPSNNISQKVKYGSPEELPDYISDAFYRNDNGKYVNITDELGLRNYAFGLGVVASDLNHDGLVDIYVANDYERPDLMYINQGGGRFANQLDVKVKHTSYTAMGCDAADIDNDGLVDLAVVDMQSSDHYRSKTNMPSMDIDQFWSFVSKGYNYQYMSNVLQLNSGRGFFQDIAQYSGLAGTDWSWSVLINDFDNDAHKDIFISNGINKDLRNNDFIQYFDSLTNAGTRPPLLELSERLPSNPVANQMYRAQGNYIFADVAEPWGLSTPSFSFGAAYADLDKDGDLDLIVNNNERNASVYRNDMGGNSIQVELKGPAQNAFAFGSKVFLFKGEDIIYQELGPVRGYLSSSSSRLHFGVGSADSLVCIFPDGKSIRKSGISAGAIQLDYANAKEQGVKVFDIPKPLFRDATASSGIDFVHQENVHDDFVNELLIPHSESRWGPEMAIADIDGNGLDDVFLCGAQGQSGRVYMQTTAGRFEALPQSFDAQYEDASATFFDADGDGDLDLYVASGGGSGQSPDLLQDRLYLWDEHGHFHLSSNSIPALPYNSGKVIHLDFDMDGDEDLLVTGQGEPLQYPRPGRTSLLENKNGRFEDVTLQVAPELERIGMVSDVEILDANGDGATDLVLVGEWMSPKIFLASEGGFVPHTDWNEQHKNLSGWWFDVSVEDLNGDAAPDFVLGNIGMNNKFKASEKKPLKVYQADYDSNSTNDIVLAKYYDGKVVPTRGRECSSEQMPFIAEKYPTFEGFASASLDEILGEGIDEAYFTEAKEFRSVILMSSAEGYVVEPLPALAQISPVMGSVIDDMDGDGFKDILIAGNFFDTEVETTRHDSGNGLLLLGDAEGGYTAQRPLYNGFYAPFNVRSLYELRNEEQGQAFMLVGANDNRLMIYSRELQP